MKKKLSYVLLCLLIIAVGMELTLGGVDNNAPVWIQIYHGVVIIAFMVVGFNRVIEIIKTN